MFAARVREETGENVADPLPLEVFRTLTAKSQEYACSALCQIYGDVFHELERVYGNRRSLLEAIQFTEFQGGSPDVAHCYIAFLLVERTIREVVTFNWDQLVEIAFENHIAGRLQDFASVINDSPSWTTWREGPGITIVKLHGCASQFPAQLQNIVLTRADLVAASAPESWQGKAMGILFNNAVLFCGFSGSDYDASI
jgi:hypothetical protein